MVFPPDRIPLKGPGPEGAGGEKADEREFRKFCRGRLAGYKAPRSVVFAPELPYSPVGKVLRQKIRELYGQP